MANILKKIVILCILFLPIISLGYKFGMIGALTGLMLSIILSILLIRKNMGRIIIYIYEAHQALPSELNELKEKIRILSDRNSVRMPSLYVTGLELPGSFVIGNNIDKPVLIFPERISSILNNEELDSMLAYNIVQINNSIRKRTFAVMISSILIMFASAVRWGAVFTGFGDYNEPAPKFFGLLAMGFVAPPAATIMNSVEEVDLDEKAAALCRNPAAFILSIEKLEKNNATAYSSLGSLCIVDAQKETFFESLFHSHQSRENREKRLMEGMRHT